jgi:Transposase, Mutator family
VRRARNLYAKPPERERERVKQAYWRALDDAISHSDAKQRLQALLERLDKGGYAAAARCLADDLDALVVHLRYPPRHRRRWRSTNPLERSLGEVKRRTKVMGRFPGEQSCLSLVWAVLDLPITHETNGIRFNQLDRQRLARMRYEDSDQTTPEEVTAAQTDHHREPQPRRIYSSKETPPVALRPRRSAVAPRGLSCGPTGQRPTIRSVEAVTRYLQAGLGLERLSARSEAAGRVGGSCARSDRAGRHGGR